MKLKKGPAAFPAWAQGSFFDSEGSRWTTTLSPQAFCLRFAEPEDWERLKAEIIERQRSTPAWWWWACDKCRAARLLRGDAKEQPCFVRGCSGTMRRLSLEQANATQAVQDEETRVFREKSFKAGLYERNHNRKLQGLPPYTEDEFREILRQEWAQFTRQP